ncbi:MAG: thermonuclease family protein [Methylococcales bacterium]
MSGKWLPHELLRKIIVTIFFACFLTLWGSANARVYRWTDDAGTVHYTDRLITGAAQLLIQPNYRYGIVKKVYDGDTVVMEDGEKIRLLGINTPEIESSRRMGEPGGEEAKHWLQNKLNGRKVRIVHDVVKRDKYDRLLAHLFLGNGVHVNVALAKEGLATVNFHPPNLQYANDLLAAQRHAKAKKLGLWAQSYYQPTQINNLPIDYRGKGWQRFVGRPDSVREGRRYQRLVFNKRFNIRIAKENLSLFPALESYLDREIEVRGWPSRRGNVISVLIRHPGSLVELD